MAQAGPSWRPFARPAAPASRHVRWSITSACGNADAKVATDGLRRLAMGEMAPADTIAWVKACARSGLCVSACPEKDKGLDAMLLVRVAKQRALNETHQIPAKQDPTLVSARQDLRAAAADRRGARQMDVSGDRITFWFGCNMLRHAEMIRLSIMLLERVGYDVNAAGGPSYCCGTAHDHQPRGASNMAARTVGRFNEAAEKEGRGKVVTWCPSCHMHMSDIMSPGNATAFEIAHITELLADRADRLAPLLSVAVKRRVLLHRHLGFATHVPVNDRVAGLLSRIPGLQLTQGPAHPGHMCSSLGAVPGALAKAHRETWDAAIAGGCDTVCTIFHSCHRELVGARRQGRHRRPELGASRRRGHGDRSERRLSRLAQRRRSRYRCYRKGRRVALS